jgi:hypothetical protein
MRRLEGSVYVSMVVLGLLLLFGVALAYAHDHGRPELDGWFKALQSQKGPCCDGSDAQSLSDVDWRSKDGHYEVMLDGEWSEVEDSAVIKEPNRAGPTMVWTYYYNGKQRARCFMPGSMT